MDNAIKIFSQSNNEVVFKYSIIIVIILFISKFVDFKINMLIGFFISIYIIKYLNDKNVIKEKNEADIKEEKKDLIFPDPVYFYNEDKLNDLLFSIQDFYALNPLAYEEMIHNLEAFFKIKSDIVNDIGNPAKYYELALLKKNNSLNNLHSLILKTHGSKIKSDKLDRAHKRLNTLLNEHCDEIKKKCVEKYYYDGPNSRTRHVDNVQDKIKGYSPNTILKNEYNSHFELYI